MPVPYTFGTATASIPLSQLDSNFATAITIGNTAVQLGNTVTTLNNMTLANVTISSGNVTITNVSVTTANVSGTANVSTMVIIGNESVGGNTTVTGNISANNATLTTNLTLSGGTANGVAYLNTSKALTTGTGFVFDGTNVGIGTTSPLSKLNVYTATTGGTVRISSNTDAVYGELIFSSNNATYEAYGASIASLGTGGIDGGQLIFKTGSGGVRAEKMRLDGSGNLGLGVTPSVWYSVNKALQLTSGASVSGSSSSVTQINVGANWYNNASGVDTFIGTGYATLYQQNTGLHKWFTSTASGVAGGAVTLTQAMTLDASGNLGIGITSVASDTPLHVKKTGDNAFLKVESSAFSAILNLINGGATEVSTIRASGSNNVLTFQTGTTERMRIDSSGNLLVGTTSALATTTHSFVASGASGGAPMASRNSGATAGKYWTFGPDTSNNYRVFNNGGTGMYMVDGATAWTASSDERKKDIIEPIIDATNKVSSLRAVIGKYKTDANGVRRSFLIAQDVQAVFPEAVNASNPDELGVQYTDVIPLLVAAIKEQQALITTLTARITALESK